MEVEPGAVPLSMPCTGSVVTESINASGEVLESEPVRVMACAVSVGSSGFHAPYGLNGRWNRRVVSRPAKESSTARLALGVCRAGLPPL